MPKVVLAALLAAVSLSFYRWAQEPQVTLAGTAVRMDVPAMVEHAELVLEGRVLSKRAFWNASGSIDSEYVISVDRTFWGEDVGTRTVRLPGGVLPSGHGLVLPGMPRIQSGEQVLLFLTKANALGTRMPVGLAQGKYRISSDRLGRRVLVRSGRNLRLVDPRTGSAREAELGLSSYADVVAEIHAAVARKRRPEGGR